MSTSVVIVNYNTRELLLQCVKSILKYSAVPQNRIVVVDNASVDGSLDQLKIQYPQCKTIANVENLGFGAANNQGIALVDTEFTMLLNPDAKLLDGASGIMEAFMRNDPGVAIVGPRTFYPDMALQDSTYNFPTVGNELIKALSLSGLVRALFPHSKTLNEKEFPSRICEVGWLRGACLLCRTSVLTSVGGFDERFFLYSEEVDLQYRIRQLGYKIIFHPSAEIIHHLGCAMALAPERTYVELFRSKLQFADKHYSRFTFFTLLTIWFNYNALRVLVYSVPAYMSRSGATVGRFKKNLAATRYLLRFMFGYEAKHRSRN